MHYSNALGRSLRLFAMLIAFLAIGACGSPPKPEQAIVGQWIANLGAVIGLGDVSESMEFFKDGTVTSRTSITNFVGNWKFIADDTIRIDWKEQGLFGNSPTQIYKVHFENTDTMIMLNDATGQSIEYMRPEAQAKKVAEQATADALQAQGITASGIATDILGTWQAVGLTEDDRWNYELTFDKFGTVVLVNSEMTDSKNYWSEHGKDGEKGKYQIINNDEARIEVKGPGMISPGSNSESSYHYKIHISDDKLTIENFIWGRTVEFKRTK